MSSLLRTCKNIWPLTRRTTHLRFHLQSLYIRPVSSLKLGFQVQQRASCHLLSKSQGVLHDSHQPLTNRPNEAEEAPKLLDQEIHKLDKNVRRMGRLSQQEVEHVVASLKLCGNVSAVQGLLLIRCCGSYIPEMEKHKRTALVDSIWNILTELKCPLDVSHYNALLKTYLENEHQLDPLEFLSTMEQKNIQPNRVTYQRLVSLYCSNGDIEGASKILEFMKSEELPVNEAIFNELIVGHARAKNMEDAKKVLDVMSSIQLPPSSSTYTALASGYAITGDIENVLATIEEAGKQLAPLMDKDLLDIIYTLTVSGQEAQVDKVIPHLKCKTGYNYDCINVILELLNQGYHKVGFTLLKTMPIGKLADGSAAPAGMFFIRQIIKNDLPHDVMIDYCKQLKETGLNEFAFIKAIDISHQCNKSDSALAFLKAMHSQKCDLRPHYFWPIFISKKDKEQDVYDILKLMAELECPADEDTFFDFVFPYVSTSDPYSVIAQLKDIGYEAEDTVYPLSYFYLHNGDFKNAAGILEKYPVEVIPSVPYLRKLARTFVKSENVSCLIQILESFKKSPTETDVYGQFLLEVTRFKQFNVGLVEGLLEIMKDKDMKISYISAQWIIENLGQHCTEMALAALESLKSAELVPFTRTERKSLTEKGLQKELLTYARMKDVQRVEEILNDNTNEVSFQEAPVYSTLLDLYCFHNNLEKAMHYKGLLDTQFPDVPLPSYKIINLAKLLVLNHRTDDAVNLITSSVSKIIVSAPRFNIRNLLIGVSTIEGPQRTRDIHEMLIDLGYCEPDNLHFTILVRSHLDKNDIPGAVEEYLRIVQKYKQTPLLSNLMNHLVKMEDSESLQKVIDEAVKVHGESSVLVDLACSFVDCGQLKHARKVLEVPGFHVRTTKLNYVCEEYVRKNSVKELESFLHVTKDIPGIDRDTIYYHLIKVHANEKDAKKALGIWEMMQEEDMHPSTRTMHFLGTVLQSLNHPVPFAIPEYSETPKVQDSEPVSVRSHPTPSGRELVDNIQGLIESNQLQQAVQKCAILLSAGKLLGKRIVRELALRLCQAGDRVSLLRLQELVPKEVAAGIPFRDYLVISYINMGEPETILHSLETEVFKYKEDFPGGGLLAILKKKPEFLDRVRRLTDVYYEEGRYYPRNILWIHLMLNRKFEEADSVLQATPELKTQLRFKAVLGHVKKTNDVEMSQRLVDTTKDSTLHDNAKSVIYSSHIHALVTAGNLDEALKSVNELDQLVGINNITRFACEHLKDQLVKAGMPVPALLQNLYTSRSSATSSSSSDEEEERV